MNIELRSVSKSYGAVQALRSVDLSIPTGAFVSLLGPSGSGKTTLLRTIAGLAEPDTGEIRFDDRYVFSSEMRRNLPVHRRGIGMVFQDFALWPHMTVFENTAFGLRATGRREKVEQVVCEALESVRLKSLRDRYPHELSGGQQQRVAFARAIAISPEIILFDEPLNALDAVLRDEMRLEILRLVRSLGSTAVYVTHDQTEAMFMSDRVVVLNEGRILQNGTPEEVYSAPSEPFVARFVGKSNWLDERSFIRPEQLLFDRTPGCIELVGTVLHSSFLGDRYEVHLRMEELEGVATWLAYHTDRLKNGEQIQLFVQKESVYSFQSRSRGEVHDKQLDPAK